MDMDELDGQSNRCLGQLLDGRLQGLVVDRTPRIPRIIQAGGEHVGETKLALDIA